MDPRGWPAGWRVRGLSSGGGAGRLRGCSWVRRAEAQPACTPGRLPDPAAPSGLSARSSCSWTRPRTPRFNLPSTLASHTSLPAASSVHSSGAPLQFAIDSDAHPLTHRCLRALTRSLACPRHAVHVPGQEPRRPAQGHRLWHLRVLRARPVRGRARRHAHLHRARGGPAPAGRVPAMLRVCGWRRCRHAHPRRARGALAALEPRLFLPRASLCGAVSGRLCAALCLARRAPEACAARHRPCAERAPLPPRRRRCCA